MEVLLESLEQEWRGLIRLTPKIVMALVALLVSIGVGRVVARMLVGVLTRGNLSKVHLSFFKQLTQWSFLLLGVIIALNVLGLKGVAASLVAGGGVTAVVLGFAFRAIGENFLAGLSLIMGRTFKVGDVIRSGDFEGQVRGIELRHTHIRAADGRDIFIPSIEIFGKPLVNFTRDGLRRQAFRVGLDYADDIQRAREILLETVASSDLALREPAPAVRIAGLAPNYVELEVSFWVDTFKQPHGLTQVPTQIMERCRRVILEAGFTVSSEVSTNVVLGVRRPLDVKVQSELEAS